MDAMLLPFQRFSDPLEHGVQWVWIGLRVRPRFFVQVGVIPAHDHAPFGDDHHTAHSMLMSEAGKDSFGRIRPEAFSAFAFAINPP